MPRRMCLNDELNARTLQLETRRHFIRQCTTGLAAMWLAGQQQSAAAHERANQTPIARVKRIIYLHMVGAPSQLELFDYRPQLSKFDGQDCPDDYLSGANFAFIQGRPQLLGPQFPFRQHGDSGAWFSDRLPKLATLADELCFIKTMQTDQFNHGPAQLMVHSGQPRIGYPSIGSWVTWGLGSENADVPGFVVLLSGGRIPRVGNALWSSGFLPSLYQGTQCRAQGSPILNLDNPSGITRDERRQTLDAIQSLNRISHQEFGDPETLTRIAQYEMAFRMQMAMPEITDLAAESPETLRLYGAEPGKNSFANNCLLARRMVEAGVRFVQLFDWGWDSHGAGKEEALNEGFKDKCRQLDQPAAALLMDLKRRGLLEDTLVVWGGEFGRTPMRENRGGHEMRFVGRDHCPFAFTFWLAGAGVKSGFSFGETDDFGYRAARNPVHLRDFHATLLALLGMDHEQLTYRFQGLDQKLTGVKPARVLHEILA